MNTRLIDLLKSPKPFFTVFIFLNGCDGNRLLQADVLS